MRVAVVGLGYVGCVTAACLADAGHSVIGIDPSVEKVRAIAGGQSPIVEPGLSELVAQNVRQGRLGATESIEEIDGADIAIVCVGTPSLPSGALNLQFVETVMDQIAGRLAERTNPLSIVLRSTVLPSTTRDLIARMEKVSSLTEGVDFFVAFTPEFLRESSAIADFYNPPFTVIGVESEASSSVPSELLAFIGAPVHVVATGVAEGLKYASNAFHAVKVTFANEMARVLQASGVDGRDVMSLFTQDRELNISPRYLRPGYAFGGSCLPKDVKALQAKAKELGQNVPLIDSLTESNDAHIDRVVAAVEALGATTVAQIGLAFKPSTDDLRESPYVRTAAALVKRGITVKAFDPVVDEDRLLGANKAFVAEVLPNLSTMLQPTLREALDGADVILLGTNNAEVSEEILANSTASVIDLSGMVSRRVETALRDRVSDGSRPMYAGAAW